jgi:uridylate kinase
MRLVLRIGGSVVASPINIKLINEYSSLIEKIKSQGHDVAVVVGGGTLAREFIGIAKELGLEMNAQDELAISVSRLYAQLLLKKIGESGCSKICITLDDVKQCLSKNKIAVMGGLKPGITTDAVAALVAEHLNADLLVKGTDQEGVFDKDPEKYEKAVKLDNLSLSDLTKIFEQNVHKAGMHQIIDPEAIKVLKRHPLKLVVVNGFNPQNILDAINGKKVGTLIT